MSNKHILVVEDDRLLSRTYDMLLRQYLVDHSFDVVHDGQQAVELLTQKSYALVITDMGLPMLSAREIYLRAQEHCAQQSKEMPSFLFCSGIRDALNTVTEFCTDSRNRQLLKPFSMALMQETVAELLRDNQNG